MSVACSDKIWDEPELRPNQENSLHYLFDPSTPHVLLVADMKESGKTHITSVAGVVEKGITLVLINLVTY